MHRNSKFNSWDDFKLFQFTHRVKDLEILELSVFIANEILAELGLEQSSFALAKTMITY